MERETGRSYEEQKKVKIGPREGGTLKDDAQFYILRGWLVRIFEKEDDLQEAVTGALRASVGWLLEAQDDEALRTFQDAGRLFEITMTGIRGRRTRKAAYQTYHALLVELLHSLDGAQQSLLRSAAVTLCFYCAVTEWSKERYRWFERAYQMMRACGEEGGARIPHHIRSGLMIYAARLRTRRQPEEAAALYEQVVAMGEEEPQMEEGLTQIEEMQARRLLLLHAWDASSSLFLLHLRRLHLLRAAVWYARTAKLCCRYLCWQLGEKLSFLGEVLKGVPSSLMEREKIQALLFAGMMTTLFAMALMCMNR